jgi:16S rRNA (cytosine1402-N4)-methyltransferase
MRGSNQIDPRFLFIEWRISANLAFDPEFRSSLSMNLPPSGHDPVLIDEVVEYLQPGPGKIFIDCTLGRGGHALAIAKLLGPSGLLIGLDTDARNLEFAAAQLKDSPCPTRLFHANFAQLAEVLEAAELKQVDGILADLGISTNQLFDPAYGLSFERDMPLDMRLDPTSGKSAADLVNFLPEDELANVLYELAQERHSRRIARKIGEARRVSPIKTTEALADLVRQAIGQVIRRPAEAQRIDPATRTFLALRMAVNGEMENLGRLLNKGPAVLKPGGRMAVISFHSTEDRVVKQVFRSLEQTGVVTLLTKKPLSPSPTETARNPRSRSAKMRVIEKL